MLCAENEMCTWPSDSCITVLRVKSADYKCRKKEWNELKKLSIHGDAVQRGLASSFVNLVSIEEKCNGDQLDVCAVPISPWEQDSVTSLSLCSEDDWTVPHRSLSSTQIELDSDHVGFEKCCKLVLKKSSSSPSLFEKETVKESATDSLDEEFNDAVSNNNCAHCLVHSYSSELRRERNLSLPDIQDREEATHAALLSAAKADELQIDNNECNQTPNETSELLNDRDESSTSFSAIYLLIRSCFPFLFRSRVMRK